MKAQTLETSPDKLPKKKKAAFASEAEFLAAERERYKKLFGKVDWEKARRDGLIR